METGNARAHVIISGRVQGVFFRANTLRAATRFGLSGWVRNRRDGTVEAVFEGDRDRIEAVLEWCRTGDPPARVTDVQVEWEPFTGTTSGFDITR
jgi:acylphosphatase